MKMFARLTILLPLVLALISFVLSMLALFAGRQQGFMEDYAVVRVNTSMIGHNLIGPNTDRGKTGGDKKGGILGDIQGWWDDAKDGARDKINEATGHIADKLAQKIGISQWYSLHVMDFCEGMYMPSATALSAGLNVTSCTTSSLDKRLNLTALLDHELSVGPIKLNLADIQWPDSVQDSIDTLNSALLALFIIFVLGAGFSGLSALATVFALWKPELRRVILVNFTLASLGFFSILIGSALAAIAANKGAAKINEKGGKIGLTAERGTKFSIISWIATVFMAVVTLFWVGKFFASRREARKELTEEKSRSYNTS